MSSLIYFNLIKLYLIQLHEGILADYEHTYHNSHGLKENIVLQTLFITL